MSSRTCSKPARGHIERAVKNKMLDVTSTVDYVVDKIDEAYERGLEDAGSGAPPEEVEEETGPNGGELFPDEDGEEVDTDTGK